MAHPRPFRFALATHGVAQLERWRQFCRRAEQLGYSAVVMSDHADNPLSPLPALAAAAQFTTTLRLGTLVLCNDFRHPVFAAKELATIDVLSEGRLDWGVGAGWLPRDYETSGLDFDPAAERVDRLIETVRATKALFSGDPVTVEGTHVQVRDLSGTPEPVQRPHPPLLIGAAQPRLLRFAAREADIVGIAPSLTTKSLFDKPPRESTTEAFDRQVALLRDAAGERYAHLELNVTTLPATITDDREERAAALVQVGAGADVADVLASPHVLVGTVDEVCATLVERRDRWDVSYVAVPDRAMESFAPVVERLAGI